MYSHSSDLLNNWVANKVYGRLYWWLIYICSQELQLMHRNNAQIPTSTTSCGVTQYTHCRGHIPQTYSGKRCIVDSMILDCECAIPVNCSNCSSAISQSLYTQIIITGPSINGSYVSTLLEHSAVTIISVLHSPMSKQNVIILMIRCIQESDDIHINQLTEKGGTLQPDWNDE